MDYRCSICREPKPLMWEKCLGCLIDQALGPRTVTFGITNQEGTTTVAIYKITIERYDREGQTVPTDVLDIECTTNYTLLDDLPEWVTEEIDPNAIITHPLEEGMVQNDDSV